MKTLVLSFVLVTLIACTRPAPLEPTPTRFVASPTQPPTEAPRPSGVLSQVTMISTKEMIVCVPSANVRSGPGTNYSVIDGVSQNYVITVYGYAGDWWYVGRDQNGNEAFMHNSVLCAYSASSPNNQRSNQVTTGCPNGCREHLDGCDIKGNIAFSSGEKIYHVPGGYYYDSTTISPEYGERWFCTEAEAIANGWRKSLK